MTQKLAIKKLTASDLTIFKWHVEEHPAGKQKAINLNADVLVNVFFPSLPVLMDERQGSIPITLYIYGPGITGEINLQRKIQKRGSYKNYRLNGEVINDPDENSDRFHKLQAGDFMIIEFVGDLEPLSAKAVFVASESVSDKTLHGFLNEFMADRSMSAVPAYELQEIINKANLPIEHPANLLIQDSPLEDAALGGIEGIKVLRKGPYQGRVTRQNLEQARKNAQRMGRLGEELVSLYLEQQVNLEEILDFQWESDENAIAPYDFQISDLNDDLVFVDVKATKGSFSNPIHISYNELLKMQESKRYHIYRVYDVTDTSAHLRVSENLNKFAAQIVEVFNNLPAKVQPDGISFPPTELFFYETIDIMIPDES